MTQLLPTADRTTTAFPTDLDWTDGRRLASLDRLVAFARHEARASERWYFEKRKAKRRWGLGLRYVAIGVGTLGGITPVLTQIFTGSPWAGWFPPGASAILLAVAGVLVLADRLGGMTSGWIRYIQTGQAITDRLELFRFEDQLLRFGWDGDQPSDAEVQRHIELCRDLVSAVRELEREETRQWAVEFQEALTAASDSSRQRPPTVPVGGIQVTIPNGDQFKQGWHLTAGGHPAQRRVGTTAAVTRLSPGQLHVEVWGVDSQTGQERRASRLIQVNAGQVSAVSIPL